MIREIITAPLRYLHENETPKSKSTTTTNDESDDSVQHTHPPLREIREIDDTHQAIVSPDGIEAFTDTVRTGDTWRQTQWVSVFPNKPVNGFLQQLYSAPETRNTDISIHLVPRDTHTTLEKLEKKISDLQSDYETLKEKHRASARGVAKELADYQDMYDTLRNTETTVFNGSLYLSTVTDSRSDLQDTGVSAVANRSPANLTTVKPRWRQETAVQSGSPIGDDTLNTELPTKTPMLSGAVSAMFPFLSGAFTEQGIEYGTYALNESPMLVDRFNRETGYCMMVIGKLGAGKSFSTKLQLVRRSMFDNDSMVVMLDPLEGFAGVNEALNGEHIRVGGRKGLNPLEIQSPSLASITDINDIDPWAAQIKKVMAFFTTFFENIASNPLEERSQTLRRAVQEAYKEQGITRDPSTHVRTSPTIRTVIDILEEFVDHPETYGYTTTGEQESVQYDAQSLLKDLRPSFHQGGDLANLARPTEFNLDEDLMYLDLHQQEGMRGRTDMSLLMQVLFNIIYERAKATSKNVIFVIDEAHYLLNDAHALEFLETAVRHSRHYDLSIQFVTQTGGEFSLSPETRTIANLCSMHLLHRVDENEDILSEWFGLTDREINWVRTAKAGDEEVGYSEALLGIDEEGWFPIRVHASDIETEVIDFDPKSENETSAMDKAHLKAD